MGAEAIAAARSFRVAGRKEEHEESRFAYETLIRLANSCEREAGRGKTVTPIGSDLNEDDLRTIADILRKFAATIEQEVVRSPT